MQTVELVVSQPHVSEVGSQVPVNWDLSFRPVVYEVFVMFSRFP